MNRQQRRAAARQNSNASAGAAAIQCNLGIGLVYQGKLDEAIEKFQQALRLHPNHAEAHCNLAYAFEMSGNVRDAVAHYERALAVKPDYPEAHNNIANALRGQGNYKEAISHYQRAIEIKSDFVDAHYNLGAIFSDQRDFRGAIIEYEKVLSLKPDHVDAHIGLGIIRAELEMWSEAIEAARTAERLGSGRLRERSRYVLGTLFAKCGLRDDARRHLEVYLSLDPEDRSGARMLLATLGENVPQRASNAFVEDVYAKRASSWDRVSGDNVYRGDVLIAGALEQLLEPSTADLAILDAGCGTGLVGVRIRDRTSHLDGVDLSEAMLAKAREKGIYRSLHHGDLVTFLASHPMSYDVVTCAATLIHFGDLRAPFDAAAMALRHDGLFVFTLLRNDDPEAFAIYPVPSLAQGGCYAHGSRYVAALARMTGFQVELLKEDIHEYYEGQPRMGLIVALRRNHTSSD